MSLKLINKQNNDNHSHRYQKFHINLTKAHRLHSVQSSGDQKKFAEEYEKITSQFKKILTGRREKISYSLKPKQKRRGKSVSYLQIVNLKNQTSLHLIKTHRNSGKIHLHNGYKTKEVHQSRQQNGDRFKMYLKEDKERKINENFLFTGAMLGHFDNLLKIRQQLSNFSQNYEEIIKTIKCYVLNKNNSDVSKLDQLLLSEEDRYSLRELLSLQKVVVMGILDSMVRQSYRRIQKDSKPILDAIIGVYYSVMEYLCHSKMGLPFIQRLLLNLQTLERLNYDKRKQLQTANQYIKKRMSPLFQYNMELYQKFKTVLDINQKQGFKLNKVFYHLLSEYAKNLNQSKLLTWNTNILDSFATCPSPHLCFPRTNTAYTIVLQFDGVLGVFTKLNGRQILKMRPYVDEFIEELRKYYEVIIFTFLMPEEMEKYSILKLADVVLFRYHGIRLKQQYIKDLSRIGRKFEEMVLLDHTKNMNLNLHGKNNTLWIEKWRGNRLDDELLKIGKVLIKIAKQEPKDIRKTICKINNYDGDNLHKIREDNQQLEKEMSEEQEQNIIDCQQNIFDQMRERQEASEEDQYQQKMYMKKKVTSSKFTYAKSHKLNRNIRLDSSYSP